MAIESAERHEVKLFKSKLKTGLITVLLFLTSCYLTSFISFNIIEITTGESGAPPENGTTATTWLIEPSDIINRSFETIITEDIIIQNNGTMNWYNVSATSNDLVDVKKNGTFNLDKCNLTFNSGLNCSGSMVLKTVNASITGELNVKARGHLIIENSNISITGDQTIIGTLQIINSKLIVNCSTLGQFFIQVDQGGRLEILSNSNISAPSKDRSVRTIYVNNTASLIASNSVFNYIGSNFRYSGIRSESSDTHFKNCTFKDCIYGVNLTFASNVNIFNCSFQNNSIGVYLSETNHMRISNCNFEDNDIGVYCSNSNQNMFVNSTITNSSSYGINLEQNCVDNIIEKSLIDNNLISAILLRDNSNRNFILNSTITNNAGIGIELAMNSSNNSIIRTTLSNNEIHLNCSENSIDNEVYNSSISSGAIFDISLDSFSDLTLINTTYDPSKTKIGPGSNLSVKWYLQILVTNDTQIPIPAVDIEILDDVNGTFQLKTRTNNSGKVNWIILTEYYQTNTSRINLTPHQITVKKFGFYTNISNLTIDQSMSINLKMTGRIIFAPDLVPIELNFSKNYPIKGENITILTTISNLGYANYNNSAINVTIDFYADDVLIYRTLNLTSLKIGNSTQLKFDLDISFSNGSHDLRVVIDQNGNLTEANPFNNNLTKKLIVNSIPIAILNVTPEFALTNEQFEFNASTSYNEVTMVKLIGYFFDFGDGTNSSWVVDRVVKHVYSDNGKYLAKVRVRDYSGRISEWSKIQGLLVNNRRPNANFTMTPITGKVTTEFSFDASPSSDPDGTIQKFLWKFSDGFNSSEPNPKHSFNDDIEYTISLVVTDDDLDTSVKFERSIEIQNTPPIAKFSVNKKVANVSEVLIFNAANSSDIDDELELLVYIWDFDDDTFGSNTSIIQHNYSQPGFYNVTLFVKDDDGNTGIFQMMIHIKTAPKQKPIEQTEPDLFWLIITIITVLIILFVIIMVVYSIQSSKLHSLAADGELPVFTTTGKLDFVILKKSIGRRYIKFELHKTTNSPKEYVGLIWKSAFFDSSWQVIENVLNSKEKVVDYLQLKYLAFENKNWKVDYSGNGTILKEKKPKKSAVGVKLTKTSTTAGKDTGAPLAKPVEADTEFEIDSDTDEDTDNNQGSETKDEDMEKDVSDNDEQDPDDIDRDEDEI